MDSTTIMTELSSVLVGGSVCKCFCLNYRFKRLALNVPYVVEKWISKTKCALFPSIHPVFQSKKKKKEGKCESSKRTNRKGTLPSKNSPNECYQYHLCLWGNHSADFHGVCFELRTVVVANNNVSHNHHPNHTPLARMQPQITVCYGSDRMQPLCILFCL